MFEIIISLSLTLPPPLTFEGTVVVIWQDINKRQWLSTHLTRGKILSPESCGLEVSARTT